MSNSNAVGAPAQNQLKPIDALKNSLAAPSVQEQFKNALADKAPQFIAGVIDLFSNDTNLQACNPNAVIMECLKAAVLDLPIQKALGFAYILPFNRKPTFVMGYKGYWQLAMRTGQYKFMNCDVVYEGEYRSRNKLTGEFDINGEAKSDIVVGYFAYFETLNGFSKTFYMTKQQVINHAKKYVPGFSETGKGVWNSEFDKMAMKTVLRYLLSHYGYLSVEMQKALESEQNAEDQINDQMQNEAGTIPIDITPVGETGNTPDPGTNQQQTGAGSTPQMMF